MMKTAIFWASIALLVSRALAISATSTKSTATSTTAAASCTASLITTLCDYPEPGDDFAVASDGKAFCWEYCSANPPCDFVIFVEGNPYTGTGTCWLYPGEAYNASKGSSSGCDNPYLEVYNKPACSGGSATTTTSSGACAATATPSAIASVCGYPAPQTECYDDCYASSGAVNCLSICAKAEACSYAIFNPHNSDNSPYADGTCWVYPNGTYNAADATTCSGDAEQYVYENVCPKPSSSSSSPSSSATDSSSGIETTDTNSSSNTSNAKGSTTTTTTSKNSAPTGLSLTSPLAICGAGAMLLLQAL